jgi:membrane protease YdiL (CAAX protease family)
MVAGLLVPCTMALAMTYGSGNSSLIKDFWEWQTSIVYAANFFISIIPVAILTNWIYFKNGRSILIVIVVHALLNGCAVLFKMEQFTKCIVTILLCLLSGTLIAYEKDFFLSKL